MEEQMKRTSHSVAVMAVAWCILALHGFSANAYAQEAPDTVFTEFTIFQNHYPSHYYYNTDARQNYTYERWLRMISRLNGLRHEGAFESVEEPYTRMESGRTLRIPVLASEIPQRAIQQQRADSLESVVDSLERELQETRAALAQLGQQDEARSYFWWFIFFLILSLVMAIAAGFFWWRLQKREEALDAVHDELRSELHKKQETLDQYRSAFSTPVGAEIARGFIDEHGIWYEIPAEMHHKDQRRTHLLFEKYKVEDEEVRVNLPGEKYHRSVKLRNVEDKLKSDPRLREDLGIVYPEYDESRKV